MKKIFLLLLTFTATLMLTLAGCSSPQPGRHSSTNNDGAISRNPVVNTSNSQETINSSNTTSSNAGGQQTSSSATPIDYGTLTIEDVSVEHNKTATINPVFSTPEGVSSIAYSYDTSKILIIDNTVTGLVASGTVTVTAITAYHQTEFTVTIYSDYGTLTIADVSVEYNKTATITPIFSKADASSPIIYTYDTSKISISDNVVTGLVAEAVVTVTAKTDYHSATFKVTVGKDYGTLTIANVSVEYNKTATINPVFSTTAGESTITYTYDTSKISISGNTVTGNVAGAVVTVTAKTAYHSTTFIVTVGKDYGTLTIANVSVGYNQTATINPVFSTTDGNSTITYTYDTAKISISGNTVTGKVAEAVVTVTAKTSYHSTTFKVTVGKNYTFTVGNITTYNGFYEIPSPVFTVPANASAVTYSTTSANVTISGNKIYGAKAGTTATVKATSANGTTANFTVTVGADSYFDSVWSASFLPYFQTLQTNLDAKTNYDKNDLTLYIGDSFFDYRNFFTTAFNGMYSGANADTWGISSSLAQQWVWFVQKTYKYNPTNFVIHIGTNDIFDKYGSNGTGLNKLSSATSGSANYNTIVNDVTNSLKKLFNNIHANLPSTTVYWYSIEPRTGSGDANGNAIAIAINNNIETFASSNSTWLNYLDSHSIFAKDIADATAAGGNPSLYHDTVHPNVNGYIKMTELLPVDVVSSYTSYQAGLSNFTHSYDLYANSTMINGSMGDFVYTTEVTLKAFNVDNAHVTINFNHNSSYRFVLWDNQNTKKFWFGGIFSGAGTINGGAGAQSYLDASALPVTFNLAVLSRNKVQYLFIEGELVALYNNGYTPRCLTIGAEKCDIAFNNNTVAHSSTTLFSTYASKVTSVSLTSKFMTFANKSIVSNSTPVADINTELTHTAGNSTTIVGTSSKFLFTANLTIKAITAGGNCHVSLSVGNNHSTSHRFLIWDLNGDGTFYFGYGPTYANTSKGYFTYSANSTLEIAVLSTAKNAYLFVNGALQTVFAGKGNCTLLYATEKMQTSLTNGAVHPEGSQQYNKYANQSFMTTYETGSYTTGQEIDVGGEHYISDNIANFVHNSTTAGAAVNSATTIPGTTGAFVYESTITINSYATNGHISINFISSTTTSSNRFLIWDNSSTGKFLFGGASNDTHGTGSGSISATSPVTFTLAVYVNNNKAYMFINGELKTVLVLGFSVDKLTIGAEGCNVSFNSNKVSNSYINASNFTSYASKSGVSNYASSAVGLYDHTNGGNKIA